MYTPVSTICPHMKSRIRIVEAVRASKWDLMAVEAVLCLQKKRNLFSESASLDERCIHIHKRMDDAEHTA